MKNIKVHLTHLLVLVIGICLLNGCGGSSGPINRDNDSEYAIQGVFIQDLNTTGSKPDTNYVAVKLNKDTTPYNAAQFFFGISPLVFGTAFNVSDSVYTFSNSPRNYLTGGTYILNISDSTFFADTLALSVLDSISVTSYVPDSTIPNTNGQEVTIEWTSSLNIAGYVIAVVMADSAYKGKGYSSYVTDLVPSTTITPDAFRANPLQTSPDTGWYDIYVYGYSGSPDSALSSQMLPVPLPARFSDNISKRRLTGNFGTIIVSKRVRLHVVSQ